MSTCSPDVSVVEQVAQLVSDTVRGLRGQPFKRPGEVRSLVQQVRNQLRAQTDKLNNSFRAGIETIKPSERIQRAEENIARATEMLAILKSPLRQLQALAVTQRFGAVRSLLELQSDVESLQSAVVRSDEALERFENCQRD